MLLSFYLPPRGGLKGAGVRDLPSPGRSGQVRSGYLVSAEGRPWEGHGALANFRMVPFPSPAGFFSAIFILGTSEPLEMSLIGYGGGGYDCVPLEL